jgi:GMP synthase-like glutamine amidotransferase
MSDEDIRAFGPSGVILSGGPESVNLNDPPRASQLVFELGVPVLGICYGMQTMAAQLGGKVEASSHREFGYAEIEPTECRLLHSLSVMATGLKRFPRALSQRHRVRTRRLRRWKMPSAISSACSSIPR